MWRQLTEQARGSLFAAQEEADRWGENRVRPEHLLLGVLRDENSGARRLLEEMGYAPDEIVRQTLLLLVPGPGRDGEPLRLDARSADALERAQAEAERTRAKFVGPEHLLMGLIAADSGAAGAVFRAHGPTLEDTRRAVLRAPDAPPAGGAGMVSQRQRSGENYLTRRALFASLFLLAVLLVIAYLGR